MQKLVTAHSGALLSAMPLRSLRRLERDGDGVVRELRVRQGALGRDELRKVSDHLCSRRPAALFARTWLLVEGETEFWLLPDLARLCGRDLVQEGVACVELAQCGLAPLKRLANALGIGWHVLVDGDRAGETYARLARSFVGQFQGGAEGGPLNRLPDDRDVGRLSAVVLTHGEEPSRQALSKDVARRFGLEALVPALGESCSL